MTDRERITALEAEVARLQEEKDKIWDMLQLALSRPATQYIPLPCPVPMAPLQPNCPPIYPTWRPNTWPWSTIIRLDNAAGVAPQTPPLFTDFSAGACAAVPSMLPPTVRLSC